MTWDVYTLADAYKPRPPVEYLVEDIFELPSLNIIYGSPSSLKSFLLADMAVCVASGQDWLPPPNNTKKPVAPKKTIKANVLWVDYDNGVRRTHERFDALGQARNLPEDSPLYYVSMGNPPFEASNQKSIDYLVGLIQALNIKMVIVDNLGTVTGPKIDENSADMAKVMFNMRSLVECTGITLNIIHHQRKSNGVKVRLGETLRGHSSIEASLDLALIVSREPGSKEAKIYSTKSRGIDVMPFGVIFNYTEDIWGGDRAIFYGTYIEDTQSDEAIKNEIIKVIQANTPGISQKDLIAEVRSSLGVALNRTRNIIIKMADEGKIDEIGSGKSKMYSMPII